MSKPSEQVKRKGTNAKHKKSEIAAFVIDLICACHMPQFSVQAIITCVICKRKFHEGYAPSIPNVE